MQWSGTKGCQNGLAVGVADGTLRLSTGAGRFLGLPRRLSSWMATGGAMGDGSGDCLTSGCGEDAVPQQRIRGASDAAGSEA